MMASIELSEYIKNFVKYVNAGEYDKALSTLSHIKSYITIIKASMGKKEDYRKLEEIIEKMEGLLRWRMDIGDLIDAMMDEISNLPIPLL